LLMPRTFVICDEQYGSAWWKTIICLLYEWICVVYYLTTRIRIEMKSINIDTWLVNFMLAFCGLSPRIIGPKLILFKLMWHKRPQTMCTTIGLNPTKMG
jgi:hypothetical protein